MRLWIFNVVLIAATTLTVKTHSVPTLHRRMVSLKCLNNLMLLEMDLRDIPSIKTSSLHLGHYSCRPHHVRDTFVSFRVPFQGCGTTRGSGNSYITFSNVVKNSLPLNKSLKIVSYEPKFYYPFSCYYRQRYVINLLQEKDNQTRGNRGAKSIRKGPSSPVNKLWSNGQAKSPICTSFMLAEILVLLILCI